MFQLQLGRLGSPPVQHRVISAGDAGIRQTCSMMRNLITQGMSDPPIRQLAMTLTSGLGTATEKSQAIVDWFMRNIQYRPDDDMSFTEAGLQPIHISQCPTKYQHCEPVEMLHTARQVLAQRTGDCDDFCILLGSLHQAVGIPVKMVTVALEAHNPREYSHVYLLANLDGKQVPIDAVNRSQPWGWEAPSPYRKEVMC